MKSKQLNRNLYIIGATLLAFAIGYYLYLEVYTKNKEAHIIATKSRILEQVSPNLQEQVISLKKNLTEYVGYLMPVFKSEKDLRNMLDRKIGLSIYNSDLEYVNSFEAKNKWKVSGDSIQVVPDARPDNLYFQVAVRESIHEFKATYKLLMKGIMQRNIFDEYLLIINDTIAYSSFPGKPNLYFSEQEGGASPSNESDMAKTTFAGNIDVLTQKKSSQATIRGVTTYDINISNTPYKLFICKTEVGNKSCYVCGLVKTELIDQAKRRIAPWLLLLVFMFLALIILGLPFIKLKVMSSTEQLTSGNLINSAVSLFLGTSFLILFIFFISNTYWKRIQTESRLKNLANEIKDSLNTELDSAWKQLDSYDKIGLLRTAHGQGLPDTTNILRENPLKPLQYPYFDIFFYLDPRGFQTAILTPFSLKYKPINVKTREYFKNPDEWTLPGNDTCRFRMESIVSKNNGVVKAAISKRSVIDNLVIAITGQFYSIIDPIMPKEYKFCIIDENGLVWFHSDKLRNREENFLSECKEDENLSAAIYANATKTLDVYYYDEPYRIHIESLAPIPLYLVTMYDKQAEYAYQGQVLMMTLLFFSALVFFLVLQIVALFFFKQFTGNPGWKTMVMDFISAKEDHNKIYLVMSIILVVIAILYLLIIKPVNILVPLISALVMISILFPYLNYALNGFSLKSSRQLFFTIINLVFLFLLNISSAQIISRMDFYKILTFQGAEIALLVIGFLVIKRDFAVKFKKYNLTFYVWFLIGLLLVLGVAPAIKFFEVTVNHEIIRGIKHDQLELARQRESRNKQLRTYYGLMEQNHKLDPSVISVFEHRLDRGIYSKFVGTTFYVQGKTGWEGLDAGCKNFIRKNEVKDKQGGEFIINKFRSIFDRTSMETRYLENDSLLNGSQTWNLCEKSLVFNYLSVTEKYATLKPDSCRIITDFQRPDIFNPMSADILTSNWSLFQKYKIIFILFLLTIFYSIFRLILFGTRKLFGISILEMHTEYNFGDFIHERMASRQSVMVIGSPSVNPAEYIKDHLKGSYDLILLDFIKQRTKSANLSTAGIKDVLIIENFGFDYYSLKSLEMQLKEINEKIIHNYKMVIISTTAPYLIQEYIEQKLKPIKNEKEKEKEKPGEDAETWEQLQLSFNNILSNVNVLYAPENYDQSVLKPDCYSDSECTLIQDDNTGHYNKELKCFICRELSASTYLHRYLTEVMEFHGKLVAMELPPQIIKDRIISRIMDLGRLYYDNILNSCSPIERFVLSDMAQDRIVNSKNQKVVLRLMHRGLFIDNGYTIRLMNESFRKHVLMRFTAEEKASLKLKLGDSGMSWQGYKLVLVLVMIGLFSFLFIANRAILDNLNKLFIVIGGGTVLITNLTGFLTRKETGNTK